MICKSCNTLNSNDAKKCVSCGEKLTGGSSKPDKKQTLQKSAGNYASKGSSAKKQKPVGEKKSGNLGKLFLLLLVVLGGAIYFLHFTSAGQQYVEELKKNEQFGKYVILGDSLLTEFIINLDPEAKNEAERLRLEEEEKKKKEEAAKLATKKKPKKSKPKKKVIKRIKREMQYYTALKDNMSMVLIPADECSIGSNVESVNESPVHKVYIKEFYIDEHEVTLQQFRIFVEETGYNLPDRVKSDRFNSPKQPIIGVSYEDAEAYAKWAGKRLPTEQEWEKAARGGLVGLKYPYSNTINPKQACYDLNPTIDGPFDAKSYGANDFKLYDLSGNVAEWTSSLPEPYPGGKLKEEFGEEYRVIRGGSWKDLKPALTVSKREIKGKKWKGNNVGFRCVMDY